MKRPGRLILLLVCVFVVASCSSQGKKDADLKPTKLVDFKPTLNVKKLWSASVGGNADKLLVALQPSSDGKRIYAAGRNGEVTAFEPENGHVVWHTKLKLELSAGPGVGDGMVVVTASDGIAVALNADNGKELWRVSNVGESLAKPLVHNDVVILQSIDNRVDALASIDGSKRWTIEQSTPALTMRGTARPVIVGKNVITGFDNGHIMAIALDSGDTVWDMLVSPPSGRSDLDRLSDIDGSIANVDQDIYVAGYHHSIESLASESGQTLWSHDVSSFDGVSADWNNVYSTTDTGEIVALARDSGSESWRQDMLLRRQPTLPTPFATTVVVGDYEGYLHFFNSADGEIVARVHLGGDAISNAPIVAANRLYVQSDSGKLAAYALELKDKNVRPKAPDSADATP